MTEQEIQEQMIQMTDIMRAKDLSPVGAQYTVRLHAEGQLFLHCGSEGKGDNQAKFFMGDTKFEDAHEWIGALRSADEMKMELFMKALGKLIDQGRDAGIEITYVNPLVEMMKSLSHNILEKKDA